MMSEQASNDPSEARPRFQFSLRGLIGWSLAWCLFFSGVAWAWQSEADWVFVSGACFLVCVCAGLFGVGVHKNRSGLALAGILLWFTAAFILPRFAPTCWIGNGWLDVPITVTVVDANTETPVSGATVRVSTRAGMRASAQTDEDGIAKVTTELTHHFETRRMPFCGSETRRSFQLRLHSIEVDAMGYKSARSILADVMGAEVWNDDELPLPPIKIKIHPK